LNRKAWSQDPFKRLIAVQTLLEFMVPSFFALVALVPSPSGGPGGSSTWRFAALVTGAIGLAWTARTTFFAFRRRHELDGWARMQLRFQGLAFVEYVSILAFSALNRLTWTVGVMIFLFASGAFETWVFFADLPDEEQSGSNGTRAAA
jgi:hypothetical protein